MLICELKDFPGANTLAYFSLSISEDDKCLMTSTPGACAIKHYGFIVYGKMTIFVVS
jgi:hypothetical protein